MAEAEFSAIITLMAATIPSHLTSGKPPILPPESIIAFTSLHLETAATAPGPGLLAKKMKIILDASSASKGCCCRAGSFLVQRAAS
jgi:hypothetical protein